MADKKTKIAAAAVIWITVCYLGWRTYSQVLPQFGFIAKPNQRAQGRQAWQKLQDEQNAFFKSEMPKDIYLKVRRTDTSSRVRNWNSEQHAGNGFYLFMAGQSVKDVYSQLKRGERWRVSQAPPPGDERWDVLVKGPDSMRNDAAQKFLDYLKWESRQQLLSVEGYRYIEPGPNVKVPELPAAAQNAQNQNAQARSRIGTSPLKNIAGMVAGRVGSPVGVDKKVRDKTPENPDAVMQLQWNAQPDEFVDQVAAIYGVGVEKMQTETTCTLLYNRKFATRTQIGTWEASGKQP